MQSAALMLVLAAVVAASCDDEPEAVEPDEPQASPAAIAEPSPAVETAPAEDSVGGENVTVTIREDGRVHVRGTDRWGGAVDSVYEDGGYLERAMPALERMFEPEDVEVLRRVVESLPVTAAAHPLADGP